MVIQCQNKEYFEYENLIIGTQMIGGKFLLNKIPITEPITCAISSYSFNEEPVQEKVPNAVNNYFNTKSSFNGLSGGAIAAIIIACSLVVIGVGVLIAFTKKGNIPQTIPNESTLSNQPMYNSSNNIV